MLFGYPKQYELLTWIVLFGYPKQYELLTWIVLFGYPKQYELVTWTELQIYGAPAPLTQDFKKMAHNFSR